MTRCVYFMVIVALTVVFDGSALAQKATELYIPIGRSPGLSNRHTVVGRIENVDPATMTLTLGGADHSTWCRLDELSRIYIDRSAQRLTNRYGSEDDCRPGVLCEVKYRDNRRGSRVDPGIVEWIKVRDDGGRTRAEPARRHAGYVTSIVLMSEA